MFTFLQLELQIFSWLKVVVMTADKASPNQKLVQMHGSHKTINLYARDRYAYNYSDPPHLLKTGRNNIYNSGSGRNTRHMWVGLTTLFSKRNATFLQLRFFWRRVYTSESGVMHNFDKTHGNNLPKTSFQNWSWISYDLKMFAYKKKEQWQNREMYKIWFC